MGTVITKAAGSLADPSELNVVIFHGVDGYPEKSWYMWLAKKLRAVGCNVIVPQLPTRLPDEFWLKTAGLDPALCAFTEDGKLTKNQPEIIRRPDGTVSLKFSAGMGIVVEEKGLLVKKKNNNLLKKKDGTSNTEVQSVLYKFLSKNPDVLRSEGKRSYTFDKDTEFVVETDVARKYLSYDDQTRKEWVAEADKALEGLDPGNTFLIFHSLGGGLGWRLLEKTKKPYGAVFAVSPVSGPIKLSECYPRLKTFHKKGFNGKAIRRGANYIEFLVGSNDKDVPPEQSLQLAKNSFADKFIVVKGGGHLNKFSKQKFDEINGFPFLLERVLKKTNVPLPDRKLSASFSKYLNKIVVNCSL